MKVLWGGEKILFAEPVDAVLNEDMILCTEKKAGRI